MLQKLINAIADKVVEKIKPELYEVHDRIDDLIEDMECMEDLGNYPYDTLADVSFTDVEQKFLERVGKEGTLKTILEKYIMRFIISTAHLKESEEVMGRHMCISIMERFKEDLVGQTAEKIKTDFLTMEHEKIQK